MWMLCSTGIVASPSTVAVESGLNFGCVWKGCFLHLRCHRHTHTWLGIPFKFHSYWQVFQMGHSCGKLEKPYVEVEYSTVFLLAKRIKVETAEKRPWRRWSNCWFCRDVFDDLHQILRGLSFCLGCIRNLVMPTQLYPCFKCPIYRFSFWLVMCTFNTSTLNGIVGYFKNGPIPF